VFISKSTISSATNFAINSDATTDNDQVFGIPMNLDPHQIYNISVITKSVIIKLFYSLPFSSEIKMKGSFGILFL